MRVFLCAPMCCLFAAAVCADVRINEFLADNGGSFTLPNGDTPDWIEPHNDGGAPVDLAGWFLTDNANNPAKWEFPDAPESVVAADGYALVIADGSGTPVKDGRLHANFSLSKDGEYLTLVMPDGVTVAQAFAPSFPPQLKVVIRCTFDGNAPSAQNGFTYNAPIPVSQTTTLRAAVVDAKSVRQNTATFTWLFLEDVIRQGHATPSGFPGDNTPDSNYHHMEYGMHQNIVDAGTARLRDGMTNAIPTLSLVTEPANLFSPQSGIYVNPNNDGRAWERPVSIELIDPVRGAAREFHIDAGIRIRGAASRSPGNPKHSFRLFFRSEYGESKLRFPLLPPHRQ